jgi:nucleotide-binding universal stress UspA family protein
MSDPTGVKGGKMPDYTILVPYNFTRQDQKALDFLLNTLAHLPNADITLFHGYTPVPEISSRENPIMEKVRGNLSYLNQTIKNQQESLEQAKTHLAAKGFAADRINTLFKARKKDVAAEIIDLAKRRAFDMVILSRNPGKVTRFFSGSVYNKVVQAVRGIAVCVVS